MAKRKERKGIKGSGEKEGYCFGLFWAALAEEEVFGSLKCQNYLLLLSFAVLTQREIKSESYSAFSSVLCVCCDLWIVFGCVWVRIVGGRLQTFMAINR